MGRFAQGPVSRAHSTSGSAATRPSTRRWSARTWWRHSGTPRAARPTSSRNAPGN